MNCIKNGAISSRLLKNFISKTSLFDIFLYVAWPISYMKTKVKECAGILIKRKMCGMGVRMVNDVYFGLFF